MKKLSNKQINRNAEGIIFENFEPLNRQISEYDRPADLVLRALGEDVDNISIQTFANLVNVYEFLKENPISNTAQLMFAKSQLSKENEDEK